MSLATKTIRKRHRRLWAPGRLAICVRRQWNKIIECVLHGLLLSWDRHFARRLYDAGGSVTEKWFLESLISVITCRFPEWLEKAKDAQTASLCRTETRREHSYTITMSHHVSRYKVKSPREKPSMLLKWYMKSLRHGLRHSLRHEGNTTQEEEAWAR